MTRNEIWQLVEEELATTKPTTIGELTPRFGRLMSAYYRTLARNFKMCLDCNRLNSTDSMFCLTCGSARLEEVGEELPFDIGDMVKVVIEGKELCFTVTKIDNTLGQVMVCGKFGGFNASLVKKIYSPSELV